jgi:hypothetical protein
LVDQKGTKANKEINLRETVSKRVSGRIGMPRRDALLLSLLFLLWKAAVGGEWGAGCGTHIGNSLSKQINPLHLHFMYIHQLARRQHINECITDHQLNASVVGISP